MLSSWEKKTLIEAPSIRLASAAKSMWVKVNAWAVFTKLVSLPNKHQTFHTADCINFAVANVSRVQPAA